MELFALCVKLTSVDKILMEMEEKKEVNS